MEPGPSPPTAPFRRESRANRGIGLLSANRKILERAVVPLRFSSLADLNLRLCDSILIDEGNKSFWLDESTGKRCYLLSAKDLSIQPEGIHPWSWRRSSRSRFSEVGQLLGTGRGFGIFAVVRELSPGTTYTARLLFQLPAASPPVGFRVLVAIGDRTVVPQHTVWLREEGEDGKTIGVAAAGKNRRPRREGWTAVELGDFYIDDGDSNQTVYIGGGIPKFGEGKELAIVEGIEVRPKGDEGEGFYIDDGDSNQTVYIGGGIPKFGEGKELAIVEGIEVRPKGDGGEGRGPPAGEIEPGPSTPRRRQQHPEPSCLMPTVNAGGEDDTAEEMEFSERSLRGAAAAASLRSSSSSSSATYSLHSSFDAGDRHFISECEEIPSFRWLPDSFWSSPPEDHDADPWKARLPSDYRDILARAAAPVSFSSSEELYARFCKPLLVDQGTKSFMIEESTGKKCYMLSLDALEIEQGTGPRFIFQNPVPRSRFGARSTDRKALWGRSFRIAGRMNVLELSPGTAYTAHLVFAVSSKLLVHQGFLDAAVEVRGCTVSERRLWLEPEETAKRIRSILAGVGEPVGSRPVVAAARHREDGWLEVELGGFFVGDGDGKGSVKVRVEDTGGVNSRGIVVEGIDFRPIKEALAGDDHTR